MENKNIFIEQISPFDASTTFEKLVESAKQKNWKTNSINYVQHTAAKSDDEIKPIQVLEICKYEYSDFL